MPNALTRRATKPSLKSVATLKEIRKRDGSIAPFDKDRIKSAIHRAMLAAGEGSEESAALVMSAVVSALEKSYRLRKDYLPTVEDVQDTVEAELIYKNFAKTAKGYIIYRE